MRAEVLSRTGSAFTTFMPLRKPFFCRQDLPLRIRRAFLEGYVLSKAAFNCHVWSALAAGEHAIFEAAYLRCVRSLLPAALRKADAHVPNSVVPGLVSAIDAKEVFSVRRLLYFGRLVAGESDHAFSLLFFEDRATNSWLSMLREDFRWLRVHATVSELPQGESVAAWGVFVAANPRGWRNIVRAAKVNCAATRQVNSHAWHAHRHIAALFDEVLVAP